MQNKSVHILTGLLVLGSVILFAGRIVPANIGLLGLAIIWISLLPGLVYLASEDRAPVPFFPVTGVFYAVFFGLPVFTIPLAWKDASSIVIFSRVPVVEIRAGVLIVVFLGIAGMAAFFWGSRRYFFSRIPRFRFPEFVQEAKVGPLLWVLVIAHLTFEYVPYLQGLPSLGRFLGPSGFVAFGGFYFLWRRGRLSRPEVLIIGLVLVPLELYWRIRVLFLTDIILFLVFVIFLLWRDGRMKLIALSSVLILAILTFYGTSTALRHSAEPGLERISKTGKRFLEFMTEGKLSGRVDTEAVGRFGSLVMRTSHLWVFHIVEDKSPDPVPYWKGESYKPLFTSFIPRVLYPGKPEERAGSEFGRRFGFLTPRDLHISFNLPWITEMAANFGPWGVVGGMCLVGLFLGFLERVFNAPGMTDLEFTLGLSLIFPLVYPESNFSVMVGSMLPLFIALLVYFCVGSLALKQAEKFGWSGDG